MGENLACRLLTQRGFVVLERNVHSRFGEIDVIGEKDGILHFCEVRLRSSLDFGAPEETVTGKKLMRLKKTILCYFQNHGYRNWQFDIIAIFLEKKSEKMTPKITWYKNLPLE